MENYKTNPDDQAFPDSISNGLTKLEYFAGLALQGILANSSAVKSHIDAYNAVKAAKDLINELNKDK